MILPSYGVPACILSATTLASSVGSVVGEPKDAFLRSVAFYTDDDTEWGIEVVDPPPKKRGSRKPIVESMTGVIALSKIQAGDRIKSVNGKRIGVSYNAARTRDLIKQCVTNEKIFWLAVGNDMGEDILVEATLIKPWPDMRCEEMGIVVWHWGTLCIRSIQKESFFANSVLKEADEIVSVNDIDCWGTKVGPEGFNHLVDQLPREVTVVVKRGKQRWTGRFG
eukprot:scaffold9895_cov108-Cylindrotheca_fusiformis.AAC.2